MPRRMFSWLRGFAGVTAAAALTFALVASALAAKAVNPKAGKSYTGTTSERPVNGFHAPVSFTVSKSGKKLLMFRYSTFGCNSAKGVTGDPFTQPYAIKGVGTVKVKSNGSFSVKNAVSVYRALSLLTITTTSVTGKFKTAKSASGKITYSQRFRSLGGPGALPCGPKTYRFTAKTK